MNRAGSGCFCISTFLLNYNGRILEIAIYCFVTIGI